MVVDLQGIASSRTSQQLARNSDFGIAYIDFPKKLVEGGANDGTAQDEVPLF